jgi:hypothetical protein
MLLLQPVLVTGPSAETGITTPLQLSDAVVPLGAGIVGLQPRFSVGAQVITGGVSSKQVFNPNGEIKSFRSAVDVDEDFVLINKDSKGCEPH